jgi:hypothetical protein
MSLGACASVVILGFIFAAAVMQKSSRPKRTTILIGLITGITIRQICLRCGATIPSNHQRIDVAIRRVVVLAEAPGSQHCCSRPSYPVHQGRSGRCRSGGPGSRSSHHRELFARGYGESPLVRSSGFSFSRSCLGVRFHCRRG